MAGRPGLRPPGYRPPGYRPPHWRPPAWRPPVYRPPYVRPPHYRWGRYFWHPAWAWYHTAVVAGATLVFINSLPANGSDCEEIRDQGETLYVCNGVVYRATLYKDEKVYEVVSSDKDSRQASAAPKFTENDQFVELRLESPFLRGDRVRILQTALQAIGFELGTIDGVFGRGTDQAVRAFQEWYGLPVTGVVDIETANGIPDEYTAIIAPPQAPSTNQSDMSAEPKQDVNAASTDSEAQGEPGGEDNQSTGGTGLAEDDRTDAREAEEDAKEEPASKPAAE